MCGMLINIDKLQYMYNSLALDSIIYWDYSTFGEDSNYALTTTMKNIPTKFI